MTIQEYIDGFGDQIQFPSLLSELQNFEAPISAKAIKAHRVYLKCLKRKHFDVADKIRVKYGRGFPKPCDRTIELMHLMLAKK
jgi:hypothetical protein